MQIVDAIKNLAVAIKGSGQASDITTDQIAEAIQYIADNWSAGSEDPVTVDTLGGATDTGKAVMKAESKEAARTAIGAGEPYTLPAAGDSLGGVKKAAAVSAVSAADATAAGDAYGKTAAQSLVTLANANKAAINAVLASLKAAGIMS